MLEVSTLPASPSKAAADQHAGGGFQLPTSDSHCGGEDDCLFMVDDDSSLLDYIDFTACCDDVVVPSFFDADGDILPDLEVDPTEELLAEFEDHQTTCSPADNHHHAEPPPPDKKEGEERPPGGGEEKKTKGGGGDEVLSAVTTEDSAAADTKLASAEGQSNKKTTKPSKNTHSGGIKKKVKVEWTPELHRKFVQAVEQLGIDKAVPSRILEIMGIQCLTRHNIASHLQKYRSHRKHLMAREAEAATWSQKRQMYAAAAASTGGGQVAAAAPMRTTNKDMSAAAAGPWVVPTIGFPPPPFGIRPLHVWGHPPAGVEAPVLPVWPRHLAPPPRPWAYWQQYNNAACSRKWGPTQGTPCVPPPPPAMLPRFPAPPPVPGMVPHPMYRPIQPTPPPIPPPHDQSSKLLQLDAHPSKESIDAAIGDVLVKPWLPLPLGLRPPSLDSVMSELHKQGIPSIPPTSGSPPMHPSTPR